MKILNYRRMLSTFGLAAIVIFDGSELRAQTANWTNFAGGNWNVAANWDLDFTGANVVPAEATNATINAAGAVTVDYNTPMVATSFGALTLDGGAILNINAGGFNQDLGGAGTAPLTLGSGTVNVGPSGVWTATNGGTSTIALGGSLNVSGSAYLAPVPTTSPLVISAGGNLNVNSGGKLLIADGGLTAVSGTVVVAGNLTISNSANLNLLTGSATTVEGGVLLLTNNTGTVALGEATGSDANAGAAFTNNAGQVTFGPQLVIRSRDTRFTMNGGTLDLLGGLNHNTTGNDARQWFRINGGTANLNAVTINRAVLNTGGLLIQDGVVNSASIRIGTGVAAANSRMDGGLWTNAGAFYIGDRNNPATGARRTYFVMNGGELVTLGSDGIIINNQGQTTLAAPTDDGGTLDINGGTITAEGIYLNGPAVTANAYARFELSAGTVYLGSVGLVANTSGPDMTAVFTLTGGTLAAKDAWASSANLPLGGTMTFKAADAAGVARSITLNGVLSSVGGVIKTGAGTLTLNGANSYSGATTINEGTLALGATGALLNTPQINVASGATFDVSAVAGYTLAAGKILSGEGTVSGGATAGSGSILRPAGAGTVGVLRFSGGLTQGGGVINTIEFGALTNDVIEITGDLNLNAGGTNSFVISSLGGSIAPGTYTLIHYSGTLLNGGATNFTLSGILGTVVHNAGAKTISVTTPGLRAPTSIFWVGTGGGGNWDAINSLNWNDGAPAAYFVNGDAVRFDVNGAANPAVNLVAAVAPASVTVDAATDYVFGGSGSIGGTGGLTKTNVGKLTIQTTNSYTGGTVIQGGTVSVATLANGASASGIGASPAGSANLVLDAGTLQYSGGTVVTDRGATLGGNGGTVEVQSSATTLTLGGSVIGDGSLTKAGAGSLVLSGVNSYTNGTVLTGGVLQLNTGTAAGTGGITNNSATLRVSGATTIDNQINFNGVCALEFTGVGSGNVPLRGAWTGAGTVNVNFLTQNASQTFSIGGEGAGGGHLWDFSGTVNFGTSPGFVRLNNNATFNFGSSNATFNLGTSNLIFVQRNGGTTTHLGALLGGPATTLSGARNDVSGITTYSIGGKNLDTVFEGMITNGQNSASIRPASIIKVGTGKLTLTGLSPYTGATTVEAGTLQVDGQITASTITVVGGTLAGNGSIGGAVAINFGAQLSPGASVGQLTMTSSLQLDFGSTTYMELDKANGTNDAVIGLSNVSYGGDLVVTNLGGALTGGDTFVLFAATPGGYAGAFDSITLPPLPATLIWDTSNLLVDGSIRVSGPTLNVVNNGTSLDFSWAGTFKLQAQTNSPGAGLGNNWFDYPGGGSSPVNVPVNPAVGSVFFRIATP